MFCTHDNEFLIIHNNHKDRKYIEKTGQGVEGFRIFVIFGQ